MVTRGLRVLPLVLCLGLGYAQTSASIEGSVADPSGAIVRGASVGIRESLTNDHRRLATDERGRFLFLGLEPGVYSVEVTHPGFRLETRTGLRLNTGRTATANFTLQVGATQERIVVTSEAPLVSLAPTDWGGSTDRRELESLPMRSRDVLDLVTQEPGVNTLTNVQPELNRGLSLRVSVNGGRPSQNSFRLDGVYMNDASSSAPASATNALLGVEGIQELRLVTSPFSAEYGRAAAAAIVAVTRSGSNGLHGSAYELFRNNATDARNFFDPPGVAIPPLRKNHFGGLLSGPIRRDRLFYLGNYEGLRQSSSMASRVVTLGPEPRQGRIPSLSGGVQTVTVSTAVRPYLDLYPLPNGTNFRDGTGEFIASLPSPSREDYGAAKFNWIASDRWRLAARYTVDYANHNIPDPFLLFNLFERSHYHVLHTEAQFLQSPSTIHALRFGLSRIRNDEDYTLRNPAHNALEFVPGRGLGAFQVGGLTETSNTLRARPRSFYPRNYQVNHDVSHLRGASTWKFGGSFDLSLLTERSDRNYAGLMRFNTLADLLQARPRAADFMLPGSDTLRNWDQRLYFGYLQYEVRWQRTSLGLGVRYERYSTPAERDGKTAVFRDPLRDTAAAVGVPLFENPSGDNFAPRVSMAWDPLGTGKTVVRAGAGIFFDLLNTKELTIAGVRVPPLYRQAQITSPTFPNLLDAASRAVVQNSVDTLAARPNQPYAMQFQFAVQRQIGGHWLAQIFYSGTRGVHLVGFERNINLAVPQILADGRLFFAASAPKANPALGTFAIRTTRFNSWYHALNLSIEQRWTSRLRYQFKYTWSKLLDYTSSSNFSDFSASVPIPTIYNLRLNYGRSDYDAKHVAAANASYQLPGASRVKWLLDGWELHGLVSAQSGFPFTATVGFDRARLQSPNSDLGQRPDFVAAPGARVILGDPAQWFDPFAFALPEAGFYGSFGRNVFDGPGVFNLDAALHKSLYAGDRHRVHLRVEAFNVTNHPNFLMGDNTVLFDSTPRRIGAAGRIDRTSTPARQVQFALKWTF